MACKYIVNNLVAIDIVLHPYIILPFYLNILWLAIDSLLQVGPLVREKSGKFDISSRSGKSQGILQDSQRNVKSQERDKSGNILNLAQNCLAVACILSILSDWKPCNIFLAHFALLI